MDIYHFMNSRDIAKHLRDMGYRFSMPEAAFLIYLSEKATLDEKLAAWLEIAENMPNCSMSDRRLNMDPIPDFKAFLRDYVDLKKRELERFFNPSGCVYYGSWVDQDGRSTEKEGPFFETAQECLEYLKKDFSDDDDVTAHTVMRREVGSTKIGNDGYLDTNADFNVTEVDCPHESEADSNLSLQFEGMWFAFPTPFKRGDIVCNATESQRAPYVLESLCTWGKADFLANGFREDERVVKTADRNFERHKRDGDTSDLNWSSYGMSDGELCREHDMHNYLDVEFYRGDIAPENQWTQVVSAYLKHEILFEEAIDLLRYLEIRNKANKLREFYEQYYPEEYYPDHVWRKLR